MATLYELTEKVEMVTRYLDEADEAGKPIDEQKIMRWLERLDDARFEKLDGYAGIVRKLKAEAEIAKQEAKEWKEKQQSRERHIERLKSALLTHMLQCGQLRIETGRHTFIVQQNGGRDPLTIVDESKVPKQFWVQPEPVVDKESVRLALEAGVPVEGARLEERGSHVRIR